jgi:LDH2 family malate/lactate/ureidoglycolate dehydrogenase
MTSRDALADDGGAGCPPLGGELIIAFDPVRFMGEDVASHIASAETLLTGIGGQEGARLPGDRRLLARAQSARDGVLVPVRLLEELAAARLGSVA